MIRIGLTGGMGAGKSTAARALADLGAVVVDADAIAREVVEPGTPGLTALVERFGDRILAEDGTLNRPALGAIAFADDESRLALNGIVHPLVGARREELIAEADADAIVVEDIPLLVETGAAPFFPLVIVVHLDEDQRIRRLVESRGVDEADARSRIRSQATDGQRRAAADVWLDNSGTANDLVEAVRTLWDSRLVPFARNVRDGVVARRPVAIAAADPTWGAQAERLIGRLRAACGDRAVRIDHIGSTSVPDFPAKDVLDIQITVRSFADADALREPLTGAAFPVLERAVSDDPHPSSVPGEADSALWEKRMHGSADPGRPAFVHLRVDGWPGQRFALMFRDRLRADPAARAEYLAVKERAAHEVDGIDDPADAVAAYAAAKGPYFEGAYPRVLEWAESTGWQPE
ncbi:dephospho-CoA kinase [Rhodococcus sp. NPDC003994]